MSDQFRWWQRRDLQVYPRSFLDSNGDGVGDLPGLTRKLGYLQWLGIDAVWISPIFPSPMVDFGYDISDYTGIAPMFGTLPDFDRLLAEAHRRGLVLLDYVKPHLRPAPLVHRIAVVARQPEARLVHLARSRARWRAAEQLVQQFPASAWTLDEATGQYYYHAYLREQPDLNWRNPRVQRAMLDVLRFWLDRGVDGFRIDALRQVVKDDLLRDNPPNPAFVPGEDPYHALVPLYTTDRPELMALIALMRDLSDHYEDRVLSGEIYAPIPRLVQYYGIDGRGVHLPFNFHLIMTPWNARRIAALIDEYEAAIPAGGWPNWVLGNHDRSRIASRVGEAQARVAAMLLLTLRGTPTLYNGDEIGMTDVPIPPELVQDPWEMNVPGKGLGRDPERTPMQWSGEPRAGFTTGQPWLPLAADFAMVNVAREANDATSILTLYHRLLMLRRTTEAFAVGHYRAVAAEGDILAYLREAEGRRFLVVLNLGHEAQHFATEFTGPIVLTTALDREGEVVSDGLDLRGDEGVIVAVG
ncbi:MAG: alpha-amylase family glycosyl hydrolase [Thermomicrobiales bacterium]